MEMCSSKCIWFTKHCFFSINTRNCLNELILLYYFICFRFLIFESIWFQDHFVVLKQIFYKTCNITIIMIIIIIVIIFSAKFACTDRFSIYILKIASLLIIFLLYYLHSTNRNGQSSFKTKVSTITAIRPIWKIWIISLIIVTANKLYCKRHIYQLRHNLYNDDEPTFNFIKL